jgi:hypothetical protein
MRSMPVLTLDDVTRAAYHQAGHAVAAHLLDRPVPDLSIEAEPESAGTCGYALWAEDFGVLEGRGEEGAAGRGVATGAGEAGVAEGAEGPGGVEGVEGVEGAGKIEAEIVACLAGPIAEAMHAGEFSEEAAEDDLYLILDLAEAAVADEAAREAYLDALESKAEALLQGAWGAVEAVAGALLAERTLEASRVREVAAAALG